MANQKGGVAKTTTVASLGAAFTEAGQRVLLVDLDPQGCLSFSLGTDPDKLPVSIHDVLLGDVEPDAALVQTPEGMTLLPAAPIGGGDPAQLGGVSQQLQQFLGSGGGPGAII